MALSLTLAAAAFAPPRSHLPLRRTRCALTMQSESREPPHNVLGGDLDCCCADVRGTGIGTGRRTARCQLSGCVDAASLRESGFEGLRRVQRRR